MDYLVVASSNTIMVVVSKSLAVSYLFCSKWTLDQEWKCKRNRSRA